MPGGAKERLILFAWMKKSLNRQAVGKRGEWSAAYLFPASVGRNTLIQKKLQL
jgi:hypothetical protein